VNGALFAAAGALHPDAWVGTAVLDPLVRVIVDVASILSWFLLGLVLLRYPEPRLARSYERVFLAVGAAWLIGCQTVGTLTTDPPERKNEPVWLFNDIVNELAQPAFWFGAAVLVRDIHRVDGPSLPPDPRLGPRDLSTNLRRRGGAGCRRLGCWASGAHF
jgi:hypothetical protein